MRIHVAIVVLAIQVALLGCSAGFSRSGYSVSENHPRHGCDVIVKNKAAFDHEEIELLGEVKAYDTGFSVNCDEEYVLSRLMEEACSLGADVVNITEEKQPNFWSTCYRARAELIRFKDRDKVSALKSDPQYARDQVLERSLETRKRTEAAIQAGIMGGILGGIFSHY